MIIELTVVGVRNYCPGGETGLPEMFAQMPVGTILYLQVNPTGTRYPGAITVLHPTQSGMKPVGAISKTERRFIKPMIPQGGLYPVTISGHSLEDKAIYIRCESNLQFEEPYLRWIPLADQTETHLPPLPEDEQRTQLAGMVLAHLKMLLAATPQLKELAGEEGLHTMVETLTQSSPVGIAMQAQTVLPLLLQSLELYTPHCATSLDGNTSFTRGEILLHLRLLEQYYPELHTHYRAILEWHKDLNRNSSDVLMQTFYQQYQAVGQMLFRSDTPDQRTPMQVYLDTLAFVKGEQLTADDITAELQHVTALLAKEMYGKLTQYQSDDTELARHIYSLNYQQPALYLFYTRLYRKRLLEQLLVEGIEHAQALAAGQPPTESPTAAVQTELPLCIALNPKCRALLRRAVDVGLLVYNRDRQGYDPAPKYSNALISYLAGRLFCNDYSDGDEWMEGGKFYDASLARELFGFDVGHTRRSAKNPSNKTPIGYELVDKLFE